MVSATDKFVRSSGREGGQELYLQITRTGQNAAKNTSQYRIIVEYRGNGNGGWRIGGNKWSASAAGLAWSGTWDIPQSDSGKTTRLLDRTFSVKHDANGVLAKFVARADASSPNSRYIGKASVSVEESAPPRLIKKPSAPGKPTLSGVLPDRVTISWPASSDNGGSTITGYFVRYWPNAKGTGSHTDTSLQNNLSRVITGLKPATTYRFVVYARNGSTDNDGYSLPSQAVTVRTFAGIRIKIAGVWKLAVPYVKVGGVWKLAIPFVKVSGKWKNAG